MSDKLAAVLRKVEAATDLPRDEPRVMMSWKNTDACMELFCPCGWQSHVDGYFALFVRCPNCGQRYGVAADVKLCRMTEEDVAGLENLMHRGKG